jgi:diguanylate cyclase (GGDEF)-like protein/PAS domain S-box-containing protein
MKVLVVEDDRVTAMILCRTLEKLGHEASLAKSGEDAWSQYSNNPFPLVIADGELPDMTGMDLCSKIRALGAETYSYILLLTNKDNRDDRLDALKAGADDFLVKPLDAAELGVRMEVACRLLSMQAELQKRSVQVDRMHHDLERQDAAVQETMTLMTVANQRFTELFEGLPAACFSLDEEGCIHAWNRAAMTMFGYEPSEVLTRTIWEVFGAVERRKKKPNDLFSRGMLEHIFAGEQILGREVELMTKDGEKLHVICNILPTLSPTGKINGAIAAHIDITERKALQRKVEEQLRVQQGLIDKLNNANARLEELVVTDGLTGLYNHRYFRETLERSFSQAKRDSLPLSVIMLDVDNFKQYNDTYGHPMGDEVLRVVSDILRRSVRQHDVAARYGGEEFVILCPNTDPEGARAIAERIRQTMESHPWKLRAVTASVGTATTGAQTKRPSDVVDLADKALYFSKQHGRNRVTHIQDIACQVAAVAA